MRTIHKNVEPRSLTEHRQQRKADYSNYQDKDGLRECLNREQRGLCCYCMSRIRSDRKSMKVEHWQCQARYPDKQLEYKNMLGACLGGEGKPTNNQHCDTRKGDQEFCCCPADPMQEVDERIQYLGNGIIKSEEELLDQQLNDVLNLNYPLLVNNRKAVLDAFKKYLQPRGKLDPARELPKWDGSRNGELPAYCQVVVYYLKRKLKKV